MARTRAQVLLVCYYLILTVLTVFVSCESVKCSDENSNNGIEWCTIDNYTYNSLDDNEYCGFNITFIRFINSRLTTLKSNLSTEVVKNAAFLDLSHCAIVTIEKQAFILSRSLIEINLSHNNLTVLEEDAFKEVINLERINLADNQIETIHENVFHQKNLSYINLANNRIKVLPPHMFVGERCRPIEQIILDYNYLTTLTLTANVKSLSVRHNRLNNLQINSFLKILNVNHNRLNDTNFFNGSKHDNSRLEELSLVNNTLETFNLFPKNLSILNLSDNSFHNVSDLFANLSLASFLKVLHLNSLRLNQLPNFTLDIAFRKLPATIETLSLANNNLSNINFEALSHLDHLRTLILDGNRLANLTFVEFNYLFLDLHSISILDNDWRCNRLIDVLTKFKQMKVRVHHPHVNVLDNETSIHGIVCVRDNDNDENEDDTIGMLRHQCENVTKNETRNFGNVSTPLQITDTSCNSSDESQIRSLQGSLFLLKILVLFIIVILIGFALLMAYRTYRSASYHIIEYGST